MHQQGGGWWRSRGGCRSDEHGHTPGYSQAWEAHVLGTLPMWTQLLPLFLRQTAGRASAHGSPVLVDLLNVRTLHAARLTPCCSMPGLW